MQVDFPKSPFVLRISMKGKDIEELGTLVYAVTRAYLQEVYNQAWRVEGGVPLTLHSRERRPFV